MKKSDQEIEDGLNEIIARHKASIARDGFTMQAVLPDDEQPTYTYTVGLTGTFNHPEIFIVGVDPRHAAGLLEAAVEQIKSGKRFDTPVFASDIIVGYEMPFRPMAEESVLDHGSAGLELIGPFQAVQMFYPDRNGYVPWETECDDGYRSQLFFDIEGDEPTRNITLEEARKLIPPPTRLSPEEIAANRRRIIAERRQEVAEHGFVPQVVGGSEDQPGFLYTIGVSKTWDHPEIYIMALHPEQAFGIVADLVERISEGERFDTPAYVDEVLDVPIAVRPLDQHAVDDNSGIAQEILGRQIPAVQVFWPDEAGLMPWETGCDPDVVEAQSCLFKPSGSEPERMKAPPGVGLH